MNLYPLIRKIGLAFLGNDVERAHDLSIWLLSRKSSPTILRKITNSRCCDASLFEHHFGQPYYSPIGLAAGWDKQGVAIPALVEFGFGFAEVGGVTPRPQHGNPKPRLFSPQPVTAVNRYGFNSVGVDQFLINIHEGGWPRLHMPTWMNLAVNKEDAGNLGATIAGWKCMISRAYESLHIDVFVVNVSSPNTEGLRELAEQMPDIVGQIVAHRHWEHTQSGEDGKYKKSIFIKLSGDMPFSVFEKLLSAIEGHGADGVVLINTTTDRGGLIQPFAGAGGMSGAPLFGKAVERVRFAREKHPDMFIVGVGGIMNAQGAIEMMKAGANLIQIFTAWATHDPFVVPKINQGLSRFMKQEGLHKPSDFRRFWGQ